MHPLSICTQITKMRKFSRKITYTMSDFCHIQRQSRMEYNRFTLGYGLMSKIISMGIKIQPQDKTYRTSRAGGSGPGIGHQHYKPHKSFTNQQEHHTRWVLYTITSQH